VEACPCRKFAHSLATIAINSALLNQMERDPGDYIVDPLVIEHETWVAVERDRICAAAHLHRFGADDRTPRRMVAAGRGWRRVSG